MSRPRWIVALAAAATLLLSGCSGIPQSGPVHEGGAVTVPDSSDIQFLPSGPVQGATPKQIVNGFLEASSSPQNDFAIAREFLSPAANVTWDPSALTVIDSGSRTESPDSEAGMTVSVSAEALLDASGRYTGQRTPATFDLTYTFTRVSGEWRINSLPQGIVIDAATFAQVFRQTSLYFLTSDLTTLVPDVRWFPSRSATTTRVTRALLAGPSAWLSQTNAVVSAFPAGTSLVADSVPVQSGVALVDLAGFTVAERADAIRLMRAQLFATLVQIPGVTDVDMRVLGGVVSQSDVRALTRQMTPRVDGRPVVVSGTKMGYASGSDLSPIGTFSLTLPVSGVTAVTVTNEETDIAVLNGDGVTRITANNKTEIVDVRDGLIAPALDSHGFVWTVPSDSPQDVVVTGRSGGQTTVAVPWTDAEAIVAMRLSLDGSRILALYQTDTGIRLVVASVGRSDDGTPAAVGSPIDLTPPGGRPLDAVWQDQISVAALGVDDSGAETVVSEVVGGRTTSDSSLSGAVSLSGGSILAQFRALLADGRVMLARASGTWTNDLYGVAVLGTIQ